MKSLTIDRADELLKSLIRLYGKGGQSSTYSDYIFDSIAMEKGDLKVFSLPNATYYIVFDPHYNNSFEKSKVCSEVGLENVPGLECDSVELMNLVNDHVDCDLYVFNMEDQLIAVGTHEDQIQNGKRLMWHPRPIQKP